MFKMVFKLASDLDRWATKKTKESKKAMGLAMWKASIDLMKIARMDLKTGKLGLKRLSYMTDQADSRFGKGKRRKKRRSDRAPLTGLFRGITFNVNKQKMIAEIGFRGIGGTAWQAKLAEKSLDGYTWQYTERARAMLHRIGVHLRPATSGGRVPSRDIMGAVQDKYERKYFKQLKALYLRKMAGERI